MNAEKAKIGRKYLTKKGLPVIMLGIRNSKVILRAGFFDNEVEVDKNYQLRPYKESESILLPKKGHK